MAFTLTMPEIGETVTEGTIERWLKQPGDKVAKYEPIVEVDTDKVTVELPSPVSGTLKEILVQEGETVEIGAELAVIDEVAGETPADISLPAPDAEAPQRQEPTPATTVSSSSKSGSKKSRAGQGTRRATPRVRRLAEELGVDLSDVTGTGPGARIVEDDVRAAASGAESPRTTDDEVIPLTGIRRTIAQRMSASAFSAPVAWLAMEADVTSLVSLRQSQRDTFRDRHGVDLTYLPFMADAVSGALVEHPYLNASWGEDQILLKKRINLGIAVATDRGLLVPVIPDADKLTISELAKAMSDLGERARANKLQLRDVQNGSFTLDNTGAFGSLISKPIINLGQAAIITIEAITKQPRVVADDAIAVRSVVTICLSFDHRILDGNQAGEFLEDVKRRLEVFGSDTDIK
ncbi:MAG: 2-oxo acid dehydrogenase subunit E2 [Chloroflexi bacterium]|nr:2-oxo acid dehydrogenase subunit E2 [Chloroflexota bacterium]